MNLEEYKKNPYAWPGGYQINGVTTDGEFVCHKCATEDDSQFHFDPDSSNYPLDGYGIVAFDVYWEGPVLYCCGCNKGIESEYGDPEKDLSD